MKHIKIYEEHTDKEIEGLIDDLASVGAAESPILVSTRYSNKVHRVNPKILYPVIDKLGEMLSMRPSEIEGAKTNKQLGEILINISKYLKGYGTLQGSPIDILK